MKTVNKKMETLKVIQLYKENEMLWNSKTNDYRRPEIRELGYARIARELNANVNEVKRKLKSLRTMYIAERKKVLMSIESGCKNGQLYEPSLYWYNEMNFLNDTIVHKSIRTTGVEEIVHLQKNVQNHPHQQLFELDEFEEKLLNCDVKETDEFDSFGASVAAQLKKMPLKSAYMCMSNLQSVLASRKIKVLQRKMSTNH